MNNNPKFIVFEGIDGAGKTTQINLLREELEKLGILCEVTAEPTELPSGKAIRRALAKEVDKTPLEMAEMFTFDRELHNTDAKIGIKKMLAEGKTVICDRYYYSSLAYQGTVLGYDAVAKLNLENPKILKPDMCIFLDLSPEESLKRIGNRGNTVEIYENLEYLTRTRKTFFEVFEHLRKREENIAIINACGSISEVSSLILAAVLDVYK
ncbi:MAG: dTMP kinase [Ruminococcaceae bacterium]|nr:dTMP kinase [Oscillospiraceae bacterium]